MHAKRKLGNVDVAQTCTHLAKRKRTDKQLSCKSTKFVSNTALQSSIKFAESYNLSSTPPLVKRRIVLARKARAKHVYDVVLRVLKEKRLYQDLKKHHKSIVVLGYLQDITAFMQARLDGDTTFLPLGVTKKRWSYYLNQAFVRCAVNCENHFDEVDTSTPIVLVSTSRNLLRSHKQRAKVRITHCELAWIHSSQSKVCRYKWRTFETSTHGIPVFVSVLHLI
jgi:hypothetical protein